MNKIKEYNFPNHFEFGGKVDVWTSDHATLSEKTKVIYAHDAQSLFGQRDTWNGQSWDIENIMNRKGIDCIVISGHTPGNEERVNLLSPYPNGNLGKKAGYMAREEGKYGGAGALYLNFVVKTIIPTILKEYKVPESADKYIIGSSMGGYINTFALAIYSDYFKGFGIFSPAYWYNLEMIMNKTIKYTCGVNNKIYMDIGTNEGTPEIREYYLNNAIEAHEILKKNNPEADIKFVAEKDALHQETAWARRLENMIEWFVDAK